MNNATDTINDFETDTTIYDEENTIVEVRGQRGYRINETTAGFMLSVALFYDGIQIFLEWMLIGFLFNWMITIWAFLTFFVWTKIKGVSMFGPRVFVRLGLPFLLSFFIDIIPGTDATIVLAFTWTLSVLLLVFVTRADDKHQTLVFERALHSIASRL